MANEPTHAGREGLQSLILTIRGQRVMLDSDLASWFGVSPRFKRDQDKVPLDSAFRLDAEEFAILKSQIATSSSHGGRRFGPVAFTEQMGFHIRETSPPYRVKIPRSRRS